MRDSWATQVALYELLSAGLDVFVADEVPERDEDHELIRPPYVVIGDGTEVPDDTHDAWGSSETVTLHVWSGAQGREGADEAKGIMAEIDELLHHQILTLDDGRTVCATREFAEILRESLESDEEWRHGVMRYRIRTLEGR